MSHTVSPDAHRMVTDAITAINSGDRARGQTLLAQALRIDPRHETAWLWMASVAETPEQRRECLERILVINPQNDAAHRGLAMVEPVQASSTMTPYSSQMPVGTGCKRPHTDAPDRNQPVSTQSLPTDWRCSRCGTVLSHNDALCTFCGSRVALPLESASSSSHPSISSYPKRAALTRKEQLRLAGESGKRTATAHIVNLNTIVGVLVLGFFGIAPLMFAIRMFFPLLDLEPSLPLPLSDSQGHSVRYRGAQRISESLYRQLQQRNAVQVRFVPHQPAISVLDPQWVAAINPNIVQ